MNNSNNLFIDNVGKRLVNLPKDIPTSYVVKLLNEFNQDNEFQIYRGVSSVRLIADEDCSELALALFNKVKSDFPQLAN